MGPSRMILAWDIPGPRTAPGGIRGQQCPHPLPRGLVVIPIARHPLALGLAGGRREAGPGGPRRAKLPRAGRPGPAGHRGGGRGLNGALVPLESGPWVIGTLPNSTERAPGPGCHSSRAFVSDCLSFPRHSAGLKGLHGVLLEAWVPDPMPPASCPPPRDSTALTTQQCWRLCPGTSCAHFLG